jgi:hypothetical protein
MNRSGVRQVAALVQRPGVGPQADLVDHYRRHLAPDRGLVETMKHLGHRWSLEDDRGGQYRGTVMGSHSGSPWTVDAAFTPALDPRAARLALQFPNPFGNGVIRTTFELPPGGDHGQPR